MTGASLNITQDNLAQLQQLFPNIFSEGKIDMEKFKATFSDNINFANERYVLNWAGKSDAFKVLQTPTTKTLVPAKDESVNFDETKNIFNRSCIMMKKPCSNPRILFFVEGNICSARKKSNDNLTLFCFRFFFANKKLHFLELKIEC